MNNLTVREKIYDVLYHRNTYYRDQNGDLQPNSFMAFERGFNKNDAEQRALQSLSRVVEGEIEEPVILSVTFREFVEEDK